jgi:DNA-binding MarR family transcriptional regulator
MSTAETLPFEITLEVRDDCLCLHLQQAARAIGRQFDDAFRPLGLTNGQFSLLMSLNRPEPAATIGGVAALLSMDRTTLTAALKPLERRGLITVTPDATDRRSRRLRLTSAGRELLMAATPIWQREHAAVERRLAGAGAARLHAGLRALSPSTAD